MLKKLSILFSILAVIIFFENCCKEQPRYFRYKSMSVGHATDSQSNNTSTTGKIIVDTPGSYYIGVNFELEFLAVTKPVLTNFFLNNAYASSCKDGPGYMGSKEKITNFVITSDTDFDSIHPAGKSLNKYFRLIDYINLTNADSINPEQFHFFPDYEPQISLKLIQKPSADTAHSFKIIMELSSGKSFSSQTPGAIFRRK